MMDAERARLSRHRLRAHSEALGPPPPPYEPPEPTPEPEPWSWEMLWGPGFTWRDYLAEMVLCGLIAALLLAAIVKAVVS